MPKLLLASRNPGKLRELQSLFVGLPYELTTLAEVGIGEPVAETGCSYQENATLKAVTYAQGSGLLTLADDSGLEVEALGGEPGFRAARYAGDGAGDAERIAYLLKKLEGVPWERRKARFQSCMVIARPDGATYSSQGSCEGIVALEPRGSNGFGYDPVFYLPELGRTMAELAPAEKNRISHRARAAQGARELLRQWL